MMISLVALMVLGMFPQSPSSASSCSLKLTVTGGRFSPDICHLEVVVGRTTDYALALKHTVQRPDQIDSVTLFNIKAFSKGTFVFDPGKNVSDFKAQLLDKGAVARNLVRGVLELDPRANDQVRVTFDLVFTKNIRIRGSGQIPVKRVYAPVTR